MAIVSQFVAVAVCHALNQFLPEQTIKIKWPNDLFVNDKKIAGILIENIIGNTNKCVIGVGINVNQIDFQTLNTTSIRIEKNELTDRKKIIEACCEYIEKYYRLLQQTNGSKLINELFVKHLYKFNEKIILEHTSWTVLGVDLDGRLILENEKMEKRKLIHNERKIQWN